MKSINLSKFGALFNSGGGKHEPLLVLAVSRETVRIKYDGPDLTNHEMDVSELAPALMALGELCKKANSKFNQDNVAVRVMVRADIEQQCFMFDLSLVQSFVDAAKAWVDKDDVKTAKEILEWIGLVVPPAGTTIYGVFKYLSWRNGRKIESSTVYESIENKDVVQIKVEGDEKKFWYTNNLLNY